MNAAFVPTVAKLFQGGDRMRAGRLVELIDRLAQRRLRVVPADQFTFSRCSVAEPFFLTTTGSCRVRSPRRARRVRFPLRHGS